MPDHILLSEWAGDTNVPRLLGAGWDRNPCPICGHPTGDCTHDVPGGHAIMTTPGKTKDKGAQATADHVSEVVEGKNDPTDAGLNNDPRTSGQTAGVGDDAELVKEDATLSSSIYEVSDTTEFVTLQKDVVEEFFYPGTKRPSYRILYTKGQVVSKAAIEAYNAQVEAANKLRENGGVDPENPAGIDATTIASGTRVAPVEGSDVVGSK